MISVTENRPILLVEDDAKDILFTLHALQKSQVRNDVIVVRDGFEALDYLFETGKFAGHETMLPEVVLLDLSMPIVGGIKILEQIRGAARTHDLPVIAMISPGR